MEVTSHRRKDFFSPSGAAGVPDRVAEVLTGWRNPYAAPWLFRDRCRNPLD
jgi:hypothetical protein